MNSCILMAEIVQEPQLRYTSDQTPVTEMLVQFPGLKAEDPPATLKVVGWGNLAQTIQDNYHQGDRVVLEGRININTIDRPEGFKEKRAEMTAQRIHRLGADTQFESYATTPAGNLSATVAANRVSAPPPASQVTAPPPANPDKSDKVVAPLVPPPEPNYDEIPF
jgi:single-stranded DNA-binding protein